MTPQLAKRVIDLALQRGLREVDFSYNRFSASEVVGIIQHASNRLSNDYPNAKLFIQLRQLTPKKVFTAYVYV